MFSDGDGAQNDNMKIALVTPYDWATPGGVNLHIAPLAERLKAAGNDVRIVAPSSRPERDQACVTITGESAFGLPATGSVANVCLSYDLGPRVKRLCERERFDIVHVHEPFMPLLPIQFLRYSNATNVATFHAAREGGSRLYAYSKHIIRPWWGRIDGRIAVSGAALRLIGKPGWTAQTLRMEARYPILRTASGISSFLGGWRSGKGCPSCWKRSRGSNVTSRTRGSWLSAVTGDCVRSASYTSSETGWRTSSSPATCRMKRNRATSERQISTALLTPGAKAWAWSSWRR
ncbi:MAG: glycosyltransferase family 4 protein [Chloroflexi bacterium]|nr:MAG: glycosyltransferase family 4 protein [Chloroflexota bacterium]